MVLLQEHFERDKDGRLLNLDAQIAQVELALEEGELAKAREQDAYTESSEHED
jgi:hypothetical protein